LQLNKKQLAEHPLIGHALIAHSVAPFSDYLFQLADKAKCDCVLCAAGVLKPPTHPVLFSELLPLQLPMKTAKFTPDAIVYTSIAAGLSSSSSNRDQTTLKYRNGEISCGSHRDVQHAKLLGQGKVRNVRNCS
jgi:hypothetical protein